MSAWVLPDYISDVLPAEARLIEAHRRALLDTRQLIVHLTGEDKLELLHQAMLPGDVAEYHPRRAATARRALPHLPRLICLA